jgi:hypothetical protein
MAELEAHPLAVVGVGFTELARAQHRSHLLWPVLNHQIRFAQA